MTGAETSPRNVLVSGGGRGLGRAISKALIERGFNVIAASRSMPAEANDIVDLPCLHWEPLDLRDHAGIHAAVKGIISKHGPLYGLVNNAAVGWDGILATMHDSQIAELISINVTGTLLLTKYAVRSMLLQRQGRIVNISSIIASTGFNGLSVYAASKAALNGFTRSLARELGQAKITVNAVQPGYMQTDMTSGLDETKLETIRRRSPLGRLASADDVAAGVAWLLSDEASAVTGTVLTIDAGSTA